MYNITWGLFSALDPQWFFRFTGLEPLNHPEIFACLAMVVGLYGIVYFEVAGFPNAAGFSRRLAFWGSSSARSAWSLQSLRGNGPPPRWCSA